MVHRALGVDLGFVGSWGESELRAADDVEIVVCCVAAGVAFCSYCGTEDNYVLCYAGVNYVHGTHGSSGIIKDPFFIEVHVSWVLGAEVFNNVLYDRGCVIAV